MARVRARLRLGRRGLGRVASRLDPVLLVGLGAWVSYLIATRNSDPLLMDLCLVLAALVAVRQYLILRRARGAVIALS